MRPPPTSPRRRSRTTTLCAAHVDARRPAGAGAGAATAPLTTTVLRATLMSAAATAVAQLVGCPIDVVGKLKAAGPLGRAAAVGVLLRTRGPLALYQGLSMHLLKRTPTKALTAFLFHLSCARAPPREGTGSRGWGRSARYLGAGALALAATYPLTVMYYGVRKGVPLAALGARVRASAGGVLYAGLVPALLAVAPSAAVDYAVYAGLTSAPRKCQSAHMASAGAGAASNTAFVASPASPPALPTNALLFAAVAANLAAGTVAEPLKMVARRSAQAAVKGKASYAALAVARELAAKGGAAFYKGYPRRMLRVAMSAVVSKTTIQKLREVEQRAAARANVN